MAKSKPEDMRDASSHDVLQVVAASLANHANKAQQIVVVDDIWQLVTSRQPEHAAIRTDLMRLMREAQTVAEELDAAMHPDVAGDRFWGSFAGEFAWFSIAPLLATVKTVNAALEFSSGTSHARMIENVRDLTWWSGKSHFASVVCEIFHRKDIHCTQHPGSFLHGVRNIVAARAAHVQGMRDLKAELASIAAGTSIAADIRPCDVLFMGVGATSAPIVGGVWPHLTKEHGASCAVLDFHYQDFTTPFSRYDLPRNDIGQFICPDDVTAVRKMGHNWTTWFRHFIAHALEVASFAALSPAMRHAVTERVRMSFARHASVWMLRRIAGHRALEAFAPKTIAQFQVYPINAVPLVRRAIENDIDVVMLQHGVVGDWIYASPTLKLDEAIVWGRHSRDIHRAVLGDDVMITETGNGLYDSMSQRGGQLPDDVCALRGKHCAMFVLATQFNEHDFYKIFDDWWLNHVAKACVQLDAALILKLHPADTNHALYQQLVDAYPGIVTIAEHGCYSLADLIAASDAMITRDSTVVFEAGFIGVPAITINLTDRDDWFPYAALGGAIGIYAAEEILPTLRQVIEDGSFRERLAQRREEFLAAQIGTTDGHATARIAERIAAHVD